MTIIRATRAREALTTENKTNKTKANRMKIQRAAAVALLVAFNFKQADEWDDSKLLEKMKQVPEKVSIKDVPAEHMAFYEKLCKAAENKNELVLENDDAGAGESEKEPKGKSKSSKSDEEPIDVSDLDATALRSLVEEREIKLSAAARKNVEVMRADGYESVPKAQETTKISHAATSKAFTDTALSPLQGSTHTKEVSVGDSGGFNRVQKEEILQSRLHGESDGGCGQNSKREEQPAAVRQAQHDGLRGLRGDEGEDSCSPHGREPAQQRGFKFEDVMRLLPSAYALAALAGDTATIENLHTLFPSSAPQRDVQHALFEVAQAWRCPDRQEVERVWRAGGFENWGLRAQSPLAVSVGGRVGMLRGYGNAIVPAIAAEFIQACEEARSLTHGPP